MSVKSYLDFLGFCLDKRKDISEICYGIDWNKMLVWAEQQAIVGVIYGGLSDVRCRKEDGKSKLQIPFDALMEWIGYANQIEIRNRLLNKRCAEIAEKMSAAGLECCVLKGQANALMYPQPLARTAGDIDLLVLGNRKEVTRKVRERFPHVHENYIHIDFPVFEDAPVELHFLPSCANNPIYNKRIQKWYREQGNAFIRYKDLPDGDGIIPVASVEFNIVYQLMHLMHHFFDEGIGLRQMIDYYYLLRKAKGDVRCQMDDVRKTLRHLNLYKFAGAVMYVMNVVLGLDDRYLIVPVDERRGKTLMKEIMNGGNFGRHSDLDQHNPARKYLQKTWRNMQLAKEYPSEALCEPVFRTWHFFWRIGRGQKVMSRMRELENCKL